MPGKDSDNAALRDVVIIAIIAMVIIGLYASILLTYGSIASAGIGIILLAMIATYGVWRIWQQDALPRKWQQDHARNVAYLHAQENKDTATASTLLASINAEALQQMQ